MSTGATLAFPEVFDPNSHITCPGPLPAANWPIIIPKPGDPPINPSTFTLQQLCAKQQYGGHPLAHLGGFCPHTIIGPRDDEARRMLPVVFDISKRAGTSKILSVPRLQAFCLSRCHCSMVGDDQPPRTKPNSIVNWRPKYLNLSQANPDVDIFSQSQQPSTRPVKALRISFWQESFNQELPPLNTDRAFLSLAAENRIVCDKQKALPAFDLPDGRQASEFPNLQALCATALDGGNM